MEHMWYKSRVGTTWEKGMNEEGAGRRGVREEVRMKYNEIYVWKRQDETLTFNDNLDKLK